MKEKVIYDWAINFRSDKVMDNTKATYRDQKKKTQKRIFETPLLELEKKDDFDLNFSL